MKYVKRYLKSKNLSSATKRKIFEYPDLDNDERTVLIETYVKGEKVEHTCGLISVGKTKYYDILKSALLKIRYKIKEMDKIFELNESYLLKE